LPELDGLRGIAILMVFLLHYVSDGKGSVAFGGYLYKLYQLFRMGWSGVDLFFVISGFLIGGILLDARESPNYFRTFYLRRVHRILPIYLVWVTLYALLGWGAVSGLFAPGSFAGASSIPVVIYFLFLQNMVFAPLSVFGHYWISVTWSLAVEEQFYLISPFLIRFLSPRRLRFVLFGCIFGAPVLRALVYSRWASGPEAAYILMPCRADALAMGMLAAMAWRSSAKDWLGRHRALLRTTLGVFAAGALLMLKWLPGPRTNLEAAYVYSWMGLLYTNLLLVALLERQGIVARVSRWKFLRDCGRLSYSVYLIHLGILGACHWVLLHSLPRISDWPGILTTLLAAGLTWGIAQLSWKFFEKPLIDRGHSYRYEPAAPQIPIEVPAEPVASA
jgi:peptidoglycan/LPS O-acetylase OafA/YrhL